MLLANFAASMMFAAGCALLTAIMLRRSYRYFGKNRRKKIISGIDAQPRPTSPWSGAHADAAAVIERQKVELHEMGREVTARIDNKLVLLQELISRSQSQIDRLEALLAAADEKEPQLHVDRR